MENEPMQELSGIPLQIDRHGEALLRWANSQTPAWLRPKLDPADLVQQTLMEGLKLGHALHEKPDHEILSYLRRVLANNLIDAVRKFSRGRADISPDLVADSSRRLCDWLAAPDTSPSERYARNERFDRLAESLARLPDTQRVVVQMRYLQGARVAEIARTIQKTEGAVAALLHRAVTTLRSELSDFEF